MLMDGQNRLKFGRCSFVHDLVRIMREHDVAFGELEDEEGNETDEIVFCGPPDDDGIFWIASLAEIMEEETE